MCHGANRGARAGPGEGPGDHRDRDRHGERGFLNSCRHADPAPAAREQPWRGWALHRVGVTQGASCTQHALPWGAEQVPATAVQGGGVPEWSGSQAANGLGVQGVVKPRCLWGLFKLFLAFP